jgi:hypothetical protein
MLLTQPAPIAAHTAWLCLLACFSRQRMRFWQHGGVLVL